VKSRAFSKAWLLGKTLSGRIQFTITGIRLSQLGDKYMKKRISPIFPGEILQEDFLTPMNISAYKLAKEIFLDQTRISEIIRGKRSITIDTALRFSKFFGNSPEFWINIQTQYDMEIKKIELEDELQKINTIEYEDSFLSV
jgi:addiction module HigA family antidote